MSERLHIFKHFPSSSTCPVCRTSEDGECVLLVIDGTTEELIAEAQPFHLHCAVARRYHRELGLLYTKLPPLPTPPFDTSPQKE